MKTQYITKKEMKIITSGAFILLIITLLFVVTLNELTNNRINHLSMAIEEQRNKSLGFGVYEWSEPLNYSDIKIAYKTFARTCSDKGDVLFLAESSDPNVVVKACKSNETYKFALYNFGNESEITLKTNSNISYLINPKTRELFSTKGIAINGDSLFRIRIKEDQTIILTTPNVSPYSIYGKLASAICSIYNCSNQINKMEAKWE